MRGTQWCLVLKWSRNQQVEYDSVGGLDEEKILQVREAIELPLDSPELFRKVGIEPPKGILLVGPPGCGKTMLAKG